MARDIALPQEETERLSMFFPIKLVNGFVTCDFILGCYCCKFCLNRRYPDWNALLDNKRVYRNTLQIEQAVNLLMKTKSFSRAKITLKMGHDTDMSLEEEESQRLVALLPDDYPITFMRRGKLQKQYKAFYMGKRNNLLTQVTLTPRSRFLDHNEDPFEILDSFRDIACSLFWVVGPICGDNIDEAWEIVRSLPPGSNLCIRALIIEGLPNYRYGSADVFDEAEKLREFAASMGHCVVDYLNCLVRSKMGLPFHKRGEFVSENNIWQLQWAETACPVLQQCNEDVTYEEATGRIETVLAELGLTMQRRPEKFGFKSYKVYVNEDVSFGDEAYLREMTNMKTDLAREGRKTGTALTENILKRWRDREFFPVDDVLQLARESREIAFS